MPDRPNSTGGLSHRLIDGIEDRKGFYSIISLMAIVSLLLAGVLPAYWLKVVYGVLMYIGLSSAWNYLSGYTGYVSFGPVMFIAFGGYVAALIVTYTGFSWVAALALVAVTSVIFSVAIGYVILRISGIYFIIGTFIVAEFLRQLVLIEPNYLRGSRGITLTPISNQTTFLLFAGVALLSIILTFETARSTVGLRMLGIRENEMVLGTLGVKPVNFKLFAFSVHGVLTSLIGAIFVLNLGFLNPTTVFAVDITLTLTLVVILGGMGTVWGPVIGALILIPLQEIFWLQFPTLHVIAYGLFLMAIIILMPEGIMNKLKDAGILPQSRGI